MTDAAQQRVNMVDSQVRPSDITDRRIIRAMLDIPREHFVPPAAQTIAYFDGDVALGGGRALLAPRTVAKLVQLAELDEGDKVLVAGCATGYAAAVFARMWPSCRRCTFAALAGSVRRSSPLITRARA